MYHAGFTIAGWMMNFAFTGYSFAIGQMGHQPSSQSSVASIAWLTGPLQSFHLCGHVCDFLRIEAPLGWPKTSGLPGVHSPATSRRLVFRTPSSFKATCPTTQALIPWHVLNPPLGLLGRFLPFVFNIQMNTDTVVIALVCFLGF